MRATANFNKIATAMLPVDATRMRVKRDAEGNVMLLATARKVVSNLPENEQARKLTRDARKNTATLALNYEGLAEGVYTLVPGKFNWVTLKAHNANELPGLHVARVRIARKTG